jgi:4'-phosphopantetheinyl transferase
MTSLGVWAVPVDCPAEVVDRLSGCLSADERARASALHRAADRHRFVLRHGALRHVLARELGCGPADIRFATGFHGKPYVRRPHPRAEDVRFSVSSCPSVVLIAVSRGVDVGVDVEDTCAAAGLDLLRSVILSAAEQEIVDRVPAPQREALLLSAWTRKEAVLKARGTGLACAPDRVTVLDPAGPGVARFADTVDGYAVRGLAPAPGVVGAVAVPGGTLADAPTVTTVRFADA